MHYTLECRAPSTRIDEKVNYTKEKNGENGTLLLARNATSVSNHISGNISIFVELNESMNDNVAFRDNSKVLVKGKGKILFRVNDSSHQLILNVYYVPRMKNNILNLSQLLEKGL